MRGIRIGPDLRKISFKRTNYLGGHSARMKAIGGGVLTFDRDGIHLSALGQKPFDIPWSEVTKLAVEGREEVQRRVTTTRLVAAGVPFAAPQSLAASGFVVVTTTSEDAIFENAQGAEQLRASLQPAITWVEQRHAPQAPPEQSAPPAPPEPRRLEVTAEIEKLSKLRGDGVLTEAEFATARARLLS